MGELTYVSPVREDKTVDVVVKIFNRVNSGGTKLSKGDLALAKICAAWPETRREMKKALAAWERAGFFLQPGMAVAEYHSHHDRGGVFFGSEEG